MDRRITLWLFVLMVGAGVAGCGHAGGSPPTPSAIGSMPTAGPSPSVSAGPSVARAITLADTGRSITLAVGDQFVLALGTDFDWTLGPVDATVIQPLPDGAPGAGVQGAYEAVAPGTVTLSATGDPPCRRATPPCGAPSILFEVTLVVR